MVETVLPVTSNPNIVDSTGMTPLDIALRYGHTQIADLLQKAVPWRRRKREARCPRPTLANGRPKVKRLCGISVIADI